jgi:hypothetical protein
MVDLNSDALAAATIDFDGGLADGARQRIRTGRDRAARDVNRGAFVSERKRDALTDAAAGASDDGDFVC